MESEEHKNLRYKVASICHDFGWNTEHADPGEAKVDVIARKNGRKINIEIEIRGSNVPADLRNGAQVFVCPADKVDEVKREVRYQGSRAPVLTSGEFKDWLSQRS